MKLLRRLLPLLAAVCLLVTGASAAGAGGPVYTNTRQLSGNLTYTNTTYMNNDLGREESFSLDVAPGGSARPIVMACDTVYGALTISSMVDYAERLGYRVLGAMNTDFFSMTTGVPMGMVVEDGVLKSGPEGRNALCIREDGTAFAATRVDLAVTLSGRQRFAIHHFNKYRADTGGLYLLSEYFSTVSTRTSTPGWFIKLRVSGGEDIRVDRTVKLTVTEKLRSSGSISIGEGNLVLTAADQCGYDFVYDAFDVGDTVSLDIRCSDSRIADARWVTGCGDVTASNGQLTDSARWDDPGGVNPRSAIGIRDDGGLVCFAVDGRSSGYSAGLTMTAVAEELVRMGCITVVNLDGGGSTALCARFPGSDRCSLVSRPSDGGLRACGTYLLIVEDGAEDRLYLKNDGAVVFAGSTLVLEPSADGVTAEADRGDTSGLTYTAPMTPGEDRIHLRAGDRTGVGSVYVTDRVTALWTDCGDAALEPGDTLVLSGGASSYGRLVHADISAFDFTVTGGVGTVRDGVFTAGDQRGAVGRVILSLGGESESFSVRIRDLFDDIGGHWARQYIEPLAERGLIRGLGGGLFGPERSIRRCDFVLMLYRAAGEPEPVSHAGFTDVDSSSYYARAVDWAFENGITTGMGDGIFAPERPLTRQQAFTFIYRSLGVLGSGADAGDPTLLDGFADGEAVADYAREATAALIAAGIVDGADGRLIPSGSLTRAQTAKLLYMITER